MMDIIRQAYTIRVPGEFDHLRLFHDIVDLGNVSRAAARHGITQSAASQQLREIERRLGIRLLDRSTRPVSLTPAGKLYHQMCRDMLRRLDEFQAEVQALEGAVEGAVPVASIYSVGLGEMSRLQEEFSRRYPRATLQVDYMHPDKVYTTVAEGRADIGLVSYPRRTRDLEVRPWKKEEMVLAAAPAHPLASRRRVRPADLKGVDFVTFDEHLPIRRDIDRYLRAQRVEVNRKMTFDNIASIKEAIGLGTCVGILPAPMMQAEVAAGLLRAVRLQRPLVRPMGILLRKRGPLSPAAGKFLELLRGLSGRASAPRVER
jgi:DNA-binding transcriptional LysR family regulator